MLTPEVLQVVIWPLVVLILMLYFLKIFKTDIGNFIANLDTLKTKWFETKRIQKEIFAKADEVQKMAKQIDEKSKEIEKIKKDIKDFMKSYIEVYALDLSTRSINPTPKSLKNKANHELMILLKKVFSDEQEREKFIAKLDKKLKKLGVN